MIFSFRRSQYFISHTRSLSINLTRLSLHTFHTLVRRCAEDCGILTGDWLLIYQIITMETTYHQCSNMAHKYDLLLVQTKTDEKKRLKPW